MGFLLPRQMTSPKHQRKSRYSKSQEGGQGGESGPVVFSPTEPVRPLQAAVLFSIHHQYVNSVSKNHKCALGSQACNYGQFSIGIDSWCTQQQHTVSTQHVSLPTSPLRQCHIGHHCNGKVKKNNTLVKGDEKGLTLSLGSALSLV